MRRTTLTKLPRATLVVGLAAGVLFSSPLFAQSSSAWTSAATFGGGGADIGQAVKVDPDLNRYVTGAFAATASFPEQAGAAGVQPDPPVKELTAQGATDIFLAKYNKLGKLLWLVQAGGAGDDQGFDIAFDQAKNIYVTGMFSDSASFRGANGTVKTVTGNGQTIFLAKYTPSGAIVWVQTGRSDFGDHSGFGVAIEPVSQSVYLTGIGQGPAIFSSSNGTSHSIEGAGTWHMFLVKYDTGGNFHWGETNEAAPNSIGRRVAVDSKANAYVTGWMEGQVIFHSRDGHDVAVNGFSGPVQSFPDFPGDAFIAKYDHNGYVKWVNHIGGYKAIGTDIAARGTGKVSITGFIGNSGNSPQQASTIVTSQPGGRNINLGSGTLTAPFNRDVFVATYDSFGVLLSARRFGGAQDEGGSGIAYDASSNLIVVGGFQDTIQIEGRTLTGKHPFNLFVAKFAPSGDASQDWAVEADGPGSGDFENNPRIGLTSGGYVLVTGAYATSAQFGQFRVLSNGLTDGFLAFLTPPNR